MTVQPVAIFALLVASTSPLPAAYALQALSPAEIVTVQLAPKDPDLRRPTVCTEQYAPVCGRFNNALKTYSNQCFARAAGAGVVMQGPCTTALPPTPR